MQQVEDEVGRERSYIADRLFEILKDLEMLGIDGQQHQADVARIVQIGNMRVQAAARKANRFVIGRGGLNMSDLVSNRGKQTGTHDSTPLKASVLLTRLINR